MTDRSEKCKHCCHRAGNYSQLKSIVVQFDPWLKFYFPLFWGMVNVDNEFKPRIKLNHNTYSGPDVE